VKPLFKIHHFPEVRKMIHGVKMSKIKLKPMPCPKCNQQMIPMWGWLWDMDKMLCTNPECGHEVEYQQSTLEECGEKIIVDFAES
jgi:hypothetical protein